MKKRILVLLSAVALMVVMLATSVTPGFASPGPWVCTAPGERPEFVITKADKEFLEAQGFDCKKFKAKIKPV
jgi:hypothetical protein